ncbi:MAG: S8 family serine peptidase [Bacteroidales bacterium]|nr:S8 family serine peptidase [Bacteroidales bacterium]
MKRFNRLFLAALTVLAAACTVQEADVDRIAQTTEDATEASLESCYEQGVVTVKVTEEMARLIEDGLAQGSVMTKSSELNGLVSAYGITSIKRVFSDDERWLERQHREGLHLWYEISFDPDAVVATKAAGSFAEIPGVEIAEPNPKVKLTANYYYNDTYYNQQWHLSGNYSINVEDVWTSYTKGSSDVIVAVVDGGIDQSHPDLKNNLIAAGVGGSKNFITGNYSIAAAGHGTHVAGIIAAVSNNGVGVAGIAGGDYQAGIDGVKLLSCQVFNDDESSASSSSFADAIKYGADNGALICQNSWGYTYDSESQAKNSTTPTAMTTAIDYFANYAGCDNNGNQLSNSLMKGGVVIFAAGNDGWQYGHPADYETCIAVGATDKNGNRANYSNYGDWVDICAPGSSIYSTYYSNGSAYASLDGTSMACPMVSGVAALVISNQGGQGFTADQLKECLLEGADPDKVNARQVGSYLDAMGAVTYGVQDPPQNIDSYSVTVSGNTIYFTFKVPAGDDTGETPAYGATMYASTNKSSIDNLSPKTPSSDVSKASILTNDYAVGDEVTASLTVDNFNTTYYVTCAAYNYGSKYSDKCSTQTVTTGSNNPPTITPSIDLDNGIEVGAAKQMNITFNIADPDNHDFTVSYKSASIAEKWSKTGDNTYILTITGYATDTDGTAVAPGTYSPDITATDAYGLSTDYKFSYTIVDNRSPEVSGTMENVLLRMDSASAKMADFNLPDYFTDPDDDVISYTVENSSTSTVQSTVNYVDDLDGNSVPHLILTARKSGTAVITVTAADPAGLSCSQSITVPVRAEGESVVAYPNPCTDVLRIGTDTEVLTATDITISSSTGSVVYSGTKSASAFDPAEINVKGFAPGTYSVKVKYGSMEYTKKVVKN